MEREGARNRKGAAVSRPPTYHLREARITIGYWSLVLGILAERTAKRMPESLSSKSIRPNGLILLFRLVRAQCQCLNATPVLRLAE